MKTKLLSIISIIYSVCSYGQFEVRQLSDDALVSNGETISFIESGCGFNDDCNWKFKVIMKKLLRGLR